MNEALVAMEVIIGVMALGAGAVILWLLAVMFRTLSGRIE